MKDEIDSVKYPFPEDERRSKVKFIVTEGNTFRFWSKYHNWAKLVQDHYGLTFKYADFGDDKPCWATLWFYEVDGIFTAFVDAHGAYFDHFKLEKYVFTMCDMVPNPDNHCNDMNTHNHPAIRALSSERRLAGMKSDLAELQRLVDYAEKSLKEKQDV